MTELRPRPTTTLRLTATAVLVLAAAPATPLSEAAGYAATAQTPTPAVDSTLFHDMQWRMVGPYRGGRSTAVVGQPGEPSTYWMGTTGGGMWKTDDDGITWDNVSDGYFGGSIGAVAISPADPATIYVGTGSADPRGNTSTGRGVWRSRDSGRSWQHIGLPEAGQIGRIVVDPRNAERVFVAALGHPFGKNPERGIYRSSDGGDTWQQVLFLNDSTGAQSLAMNPHNPREIYAGMWRAERKPWTMISGGLEGGVYKTMDGGDTWTKLGGGLPTGVVGKVGVTVSPANPNRVWAIIEHEPDGGVYRSDDAGATWSRTNSENNLRQRAWYYTHVRADSQDPNTVYALNTGLYRSVDAGVTFESIQVPHGDIHDLWIRPDAPERMIVADDGGGQVTVNAGRTWSTYFNQPTAELYDVIVDNGFPYRLYGAQQDNTTITVPAWMDSNTLYPKQHWYSVGGCETGPIALHPDHPDVVYAGCYGGVIDRFDRATQQIRNVNLYPQLQLGEAGANLEHRFQWVSPMVVSPHDPGVVYHGSQYVNRSRDGGRTWETLSPDLTTDNPEHQDYSGGPINHDITGVEIYNVVFSIAVSPHSAQVIWAGTDDGRVHISRDEGATWTEITPPGMPELGTVDEIEPSPHQPGTALMALQRYRMDDFRPYVFRTSDYGATWTLLTNGTNGIPADHPVRTVREDPVRPGLLYAGTEFGVFVSFDAGARWQSLQLNLPMTPITGMRAAHDDLIVSTQGRSFWILDDVLPLRGATAAAVGQNHLYPVRPVVRANTGAGGIGLAELMPEMMPQGAILDYVLATDLDAGGVEDAEDAAGASDAPLTLAIVDGAGAVVRTLTSDSASSSRLGQARLETTAGHHRTTWDLTYPGPETIEGAVIWGFTGGVKAPPGTYRAILAVGSDTVTQSFDVVPDPRIDVAQADYVAQYELAVSVRDTLDQVLDAIRTTRSVSEQVEGAAERAALQEGTEEVQVLADSITGGLGEVEESLMQTRNRSGQDPIRFAPRLDNQLVELFNYVTGPDGYIAGGPEGRPTEAAFTRFGDLNQAWADIRVRLTRILEEDVAAFNALMERLGIPAVIVESLRERLVS